LGPFKQNVDETYSKQQKNLWENPYQPIDIKNLNKKKKKSENQKSSDFCQMFVISKKKSIP
jgi:hypothetical protein